MTTPVKIANWLTPDAAHLKAVAPFYKKHLPYLFASAPATTKSAPAAKAIRTEKMTRKDAIAIQKEFDEVVAQFAAKHGLIASAAKCSFGSDNVRLTTTLNVQTADGGNAFAEKMWNTYAPLFQIPLDALGKTFQHRGRSYKIEGIVFKRKSYPVDARRDDGTVFRFPASVIRHYFH